MTWAGWRRRALDSLRGEEQLDRPTERQLPETLIRLDDEGRLFGHVNKAIEHAADIWAAELLFQGNLFVWRALAFRVSIAAPVSLGNLERP